MSIQEQIEITNPEFLLLRRTLIGELTDLADAAGLRACGHDDHFFWFEEEGTRVLFSVSSRGLADASERIQRFL